MDITEDYVLLEFRDDPEENTTEAVGYWHVLIVDDDADVHNASEYALDNIVIHGKNLQISHKFSGKTAVEFCAEYPEHIAVILMDGLTLSRRFGPCRI